MSTQAYIETYSYIFTTEFSQKICSEIAWGVRMGHIILIIWDLKYLYVFWMKLYFISLKFINFIQLFLEETEMTYFPFLRV